MKKKIWQGKIYQTNSWYSGVPDENGRILLFGGKSYVWKESEVMTQGRREVGVGTLLLGNDKNSYYQ